MASPTITDFDLYVSTPLTNTNWQNNFQTVVDYCGDGTIDYTINDLETNGDITAGANITASSGVIACDSVHVTPVAASTGTFWIKDAGGSLCFYIDSSTVNNKVKFPQGLTLTSGQPVYYTNGHDTFFGSAAGKMVLEINTTTSCIFSKGESAVYSLNVVNRSGAAAGHGIKVTAGDDGAGTSANFMIFERPDGAQCGKIDKAGSTSVNYTTTSDERIKKDVAPTIFGTSDVLKLDVVDFVFSNDETGRRRTGLIAQKTRDVYPDCVSVPFDVNDHWGIDYGKITPLLIKAIQELSGRISELEKAKHGRNNS